MKISIRTIKLIPFFAITLLFSCEEGPIGPQGPAGPQGEQGSAGERGDPGDALVFSRNFLSRDIDWIGDQFSTQQSAVLHIPEITDNVLKGGAVLVYSNINIYSTQPNWIPLPFYYTDSGITSFLVYEITKGKVHLHQSNSLNYVPSHNFFDFKVLVIKAGSFNAIASKYGLNLQDYEAVRHFFELPS